MKIDKIGEPLLHCPLPLPVLHVYLVDDMAHRVGHSPKPFGGLQLHLEGQTRQEYLAEVGVLLPACWGVEVVSPRLAAFVVAAFCGGTGCLNQGDKIFHLLLEFFFFKK